MVGHGGSSASSYLADPTSPIPSHCASIVVTSTLRVKQVQGTLHILSYQENMHTHNTVYLLDQDYGHDLREFRGYQHEYPCIICRLVGRV